MNYETPPQGISLTGYIVRRMHKTRLLNELEDLIQDAPTIALARFGTYAMAAGTSWGPALYQPRFDRPETMISEKDPETGAQVTVQHLESGQHYAFSYEVATPNGFRITGREKILGTTVGFRGLGMPAPSRFDLTSPDGTYLASAVGTISSELAPALFRWNVRGYGELSLEDNLGNHGTLRLDREGQIHLHIQARDGESYKQNINLHNFQEK